MKVLVDTVVWSLVFRRRKADLSAAEAALRQQLLDLFREGRAMLIGPVRQEILSGVRDESHFTGLRRDLRSVPDEPLQTQDFENAAHLSNRCRRAGIAATPVDALICAVAISRDWQVFTLDTDFHRYSRLLSLKLYPA